MCPGGEHRPTIRVVLAQQDPIGWTAAILLMVTVSLVMVGSGWLIIWIAVRTADGRLASNGWAGIRTRTTRSSDEAWITAHRAAEGPTKLAGWASIVSGVAAVALGIFFGDGDAERATLIWTTVIMVGGTLLTVLVIYGAWKGQRAAKQVLNS